MPISDHQGSPGSRVALCQCVPSNEVGRGVLSAPNAPQEVGRGVLSAPPPPPLGGQGLAALPSLPPPTTERPVRKTLPHGPPPFPIRATAPIQFVTICAKDRSGSPFLRIADTLLSSARFYHEKGKWFLRLFLVMPDHVHSLLTVPDASTVAETVAKWKHFVARATGTAFQRDFFEHRIRDENEYSEKWDYIRGNPVRKGLAETPDEWRFWIAFHPISGEAMP